jgi:GNAT superfamily N-acetyltransferase
MATNHEITVRLLDAATSQDTDLVDRLTALVNDVYATAEDGLWRDGAARTTASELGALIADRQIAVATTRDGRIAGSVRVHRVADGVGEFGMLVSAPEYRGTGVGRALIDFAERHGSRRGMRAMQLELLVPRGWRHPSKEFLRTLYTRCGYRLVRTGTVDGAYPQLAPLLAAPCDFEIYEKPLPAHRAAAHR